MSRGIVGICSSLFVLALSATAGQASVLYSQPTNDFGGYYSQNDTNSGGLGNYATVYDNFTLGSAASVNLVTFVGSYVPAQAPIAGFTIQFYADSAGAPGASLYSAFLPGTAGETFLGTDFFSNPEYAYSALLPTAFNAAAGTQYWLSIVPDVGLPPQWAWESGTGGDGASYQDFFGTLTPILVDEAFTLQNVPEPASLALFSTSLLGLYFVRRRKAGKPGK
jgi:PEP-CTERM motif